MWPPAAEVSAFPLEQRSVLSCWMFWVQAVIRFCLEETSSLVSSLTALSVKCYGYRSHGSRSVLRYVLQNLVSSCSEIFCGLKRSYLTQPQVDLFVSGAQGLSTSPESKWTHFSNCNCSPPEKEELVPIFGDCFWVFPYGRERKNSEKELRKDTHNGGKKRIPGRSRIGLLYIQSL